MGKYSKDDYEFEKNKQALLELTQGKQKIKPDNPHKAVWEYEIAEHRNKKKKEHFQSFGAYCGILSLIVSMLLVLNLYFKIVG